MTGVLWALCVPVAGLWWVPALAANFVAVSIVFPVVAAVLLVGRRLRALRRVVLAVFLVQAAAVGWWMLDGRAARVPGGGPAGGDSVGGGSVVRVVQSNTRTGGAGPDAVLSLLREADADVVALTEVSSEALERLRLDPEMLLRYPHRDVPPWRLTHTRLILSRWPVVPLVLRPDLPAGDPRRALRLVRVLHEDGPFVVLAVHPRSPRTPARWREGNAMLEAAIDAVRELAPGEPLVVLADLNSTPTGGRSRRMRDALGVDRCKPLFALDGTYPSGLPWPLRAAIDDAWVSPEWRVASWGTSGVEGSDHRAVVVDLLR
ncbi:MAG: endonuclease/exonuclease/phosphatase family protein [Phycisphaerales bacterium JB041]